MPNNTMSGEIENLQNIDGDINSEQVIAGDIADRENLIGDISTEPQSLDGNINSEQVIIGDVNSEQEIVGDIAERESLVGDVSIDPLKVKDVQVDGESVVDINGIANITTPEVPTKTSELQNDSGFITSESDPIFNGSAAKNITTENITNWNNKSDFSGNYEDLTNKPTIPNYNAGDSIKIEYSKISAYSNCGNDMDLNYIQDIALDTTAIWKQVYTYDGYTILFRVGSNAIKLSTNGIDFEDITYDYAIKDLAYSMVNNCVVGLFEGRYIGYSLDNGRTFNYTYMQSLSDNVDKIDINNKEYTTTTISNYVGIKLYGATGTYNFYQSGYRVVDNVWTFQASTRITAPARIDFLIGLGKYNTMTITNSGICYYVAGSRILVTDHNCPSGTLSCAVQHKFGTGVNDYISIVGYNNTGKFAILGSTNTISADWTEYSLPEACTIYNILYNKGVYYFLTSNANYYTTSDFINFTKVETTTDRFITGDFTITGLQLVPYGNNNKLVLIPNRTKLDNIIQSAIRGNDKSRWVGDGLVQDGEKVKVKGSPTITVSAGGIYIEPQSISLSYLDTELIAPTTIGTSVIQKLNIADLETWFWNTWQGIANEILRVIFNDGGLALDPYTYEEFNVIAGDYYYFITDSFGSEMTRHYIGNLNVYIP